MSQNELAAEIYVRVITDRILGNPKVWEVPEKQARGIARAAMEAAAVFTSVTQQEEAPSPLGPPVTNESTL